MKEYPLNFTQIPNWILDSAFCLSDHEMRVLLFIARKTYGWQKERDIISLSQFVQGTGKTKQRCHDAIKSLLGKRIIAREKGAYRSFNYKILDPEEHSIGLTMRPSMVSPRDHQINLSVSPRDTQKKENINKRNKLSGTGRKEEEKTSLYNINNSSLLLDTCERSEHVYNKEAEAGARENDREPARGIPVISTESHSAGLQDDFPTKGSRESSKAPENGLKWKLPKFVTDQVYEICKTLNEKFEHEMYWDSVDTKRLREQILASGIDTENLRSIDYNNISESNPARVILEPFWRLEKARKEKPENDFFWKPFRPSILSKKYLSFLPIMKYPKTVSTAKAEEESEDVFAMAREVSKKLEQNR